MEFASKKFSVCKCWGELYLLGVGISDTKLLKMGAQHPILSISLYICKFPKCERLFYSQKNTI